METGHNENMLDISNLVVYYRTEKEVVKAVKDRKSGV